MLSTAREAASPAVIDALVAEAEHDLKPFRDRLPAHGWQSAVDATVSRLLRDRFGLPTLGLET
jgi:hypothetical protein